MTAKQDAVRYVVPSQWDWVARQFVSLQWLNDQWHYNGIFYRVPRP